MGAQSDLNQIGYDNQNATMFKNQAQMVRNDSSSPTPQRTNNTNTKNMQQMNQGSKVQTQTKKSINGLVQKNTWANMNDPV